MGYVINHNGKLKWGRHSSLDELKYFEGKLDCDFDLLRIEIDICDYFDGFEGVAYLIDSCGNFKGKGPLLKNGKEVL